MKKQKAEELAGYFSKIGKSDRIAIIYHRDPDGFCSGLLAAKAIERFRGKGADFLVHRGYELFGAKKDFFSSLKKKKINKAIIVDLGVDQDPGIIKSLEKFSDVLFIDHHKIYYDLSSKKTTFIKAQYLSSIDASKYPASKMCFDLFSGVVDISDLDWIACIGILGDFGYSHWKEFFDSAIERNRSNLHELKRLKDLVEAVAVLREKELDSLFDDFYYAKSPGCLSGNPHWEMLESLNAEISGWFGSVKERAEFFPGQELVWLEIKSRNSIKSTLINRLSAELYPHQTVIVVEDKGGKELFFSARRQDFKVKMNDLLESAIKGIRGSGAGGHIPAAAGKVPRKKLEDFKKNILSALGKGTFGK